MVSETADEVERGLEMKWSEVKKLYPNQFVKFKIVESHEDEIIETFKNLMNNKFDLKSEE